MNYIFLFWLPFGLRRVKTLFTKLEFDRFSNLIVGNKKDSEEKRDTKIEYLKAKKEEICFCKSPGKIQCDEMLRKFCLWWKKNCVVNIIIRANIPFAVSSHLFDMHYLWLFIASNMHILQLMTPNWRLHVYSRHFANQSQCYRFASDDLFRFEFLGSDQIERYIKMNE